MPGLFHRGDNKIEVARHPGLEHRQGGNDGDEDAGKQLGDLLDREPVEIVAAAHFRTHRSEFQGEQAHRHQEEVADDPFHRHMDPQHRHLAQAHIAAEKHAADYPQQEHHIKQPLDLNAVNFGGLLVGLGVFFFHIFRNDHIISHIIREVEMGFLQMHFLMPAFFAKHVGIVGKKDKQQNHRHKHHFGEEIEGPKEFHPLQEAQEQGRIAQRSEGAADIGDQEDEEDDQVHFRFPVGVHFDEGADQHHGGAGGPDPGRQGGADDQHHQVVAGHPYRRALDQDRSGDGIKRPE